VTLSIDTETNQIVDYEFWTERGYLVTFFEDHFPARSAFAGTGLALGARVEIECWATVE